MFGPGDDDEYADLLPTKPGAKAPAPSAAPSHDDDEYGDLLPSHRMPKMAASDMTHTYGAPTAHEIATKADAENHQGIEGMLAKGAEGATFGLAGLVPAVRESGNWLEEHSPDAATFSALGGGMLTGGAVAKGLSALKTVVNAGRVGKAAINIGAGGVLGGTYEGATAEPGHRGEGFVHGAKTGAELAAGAEALPWLAGGAKAVGRGVRKVTGTSSDEAIQQGALKRIQAAIDRTGTKTTVVSRPGVTLLEHHGDAAVDILRDLPALPANSPQRAAAYQRGVELMKEGMASKDASKKALGRALMQVSRRKQDALLNVKAIVTGGGLGASAGLGAVPGGAAGAAIGLAAKAGLRRTAGKEAESALEMLLSKVPEQDLTAGLNASLAQPAAKPTPEPTPSVRDIRTARGKGAPAKGPAILQETLDRKQGRAKGATYARDAFQADQRADRFEAKGMKEMAAKWRAKAEAARAKIPQKAPRAPDPEDDGGALMDMLTGTLKGAP